MKKKKWYSIEFMQGAIMPEYIGDDDNKHSGASNIFLGRVRADVINNKRVKGIEYTAYEDMALDVLLQIVEDCKMIFPLHSAKIVHSLGIVFCGELCLMVAVSCGHRNESFASCAYIVERLKKEVPVWGKEILEDQSHQWKINQ